MKKMFVCLPCGGLCNRMRSMSSTLYLAEKLGNVKPIFFWLNNDELNAPFEILFSRFPGRVINVKGGILLKIIPSLLLRCWWMKRIAIKSDVPEDLNQLRGYDILAYTASKFMENTQFSMFHVSEKIRNLLHPNVNKKTVGIHIRRTDNEKSIKYSPTELFVKAMEEEIASNPYVTFYLATDDTCEEEYLKQIFGSRIFVYKKRSLNRNEQIGIEDALVDLTNLSRCGKIYGSYWSSFSETAAQWGQIDYKLLTKETV